MSNNDEDNEINVTFKKIDEDTEEEEKEEVGPETLQIVEERVVSIDPSSVIQEGEAEDMDGEDEDLLTDTNDDDISEQQLKKQSVQIEKLAQGVHTLQMHYDEIQDQFKSINDLQSQVKKLQVQIDDIIKRTSNSKKRNVRKVKSKKTSSFATKKIGKRSKKQRR